MKQTQKISVVSDDQLIVEEKKDSFVLDVESHSNNNHSSPASSSRIMLQRNFSRKGSQNGNGGHKKTMTSPTANDKVGDFNGLFTSSPGAPCTPKMPMPVAVGSTDIVADTGVHHHHQITISACNISTSTETKMINKRSYSFRKSSSSWAINPRKVLLLFATLSSMGSMLLIYLTLSVRKLDGNGDAQLWQE